jgi:hypothetical protein
MRRRRGRGLNSNLREEGGGEVSSRAWQKCSQVYLFVKIWSHMLFRRDHVEDDFKAIVSMPGDVLTFQSDAFAHVLSATANTDGPPMFKGAQSDFSVALEMVHVSSSGWELSALR